MRIIAWILTGVVCCTTVALAQQLPTPQEQALSSKLMVEINENIQLRTQLVIDEAKLKELQQNKNDPKPIPEKK